MNNKIAHLSGSTKRIGLLGILVIVIGIIAGVLLIQQRITLNRQAAEVNVCPNNRGLIDCYFEYRTFFDSTYSAVLTSDTGQSTTMEGSLPNTNGTIANETVSFPDQELGRNYTCRVTIKTVCEEKTFTISMEGEKVCQNVTPTTTPPVDAPTNTPTPTGFQQSGCVIDCSCKDIFAGITRYPTYYPNQPGLDDGKVIIPKDTFCVNCSSLVMREKSTGAIITQAVTATPDPADPDKKACLNEDNKDIEQEGSLEFRCHQAKAGTGGQDETCRTYEIEMTNIYKSLVCDKDNGDQETTTKSCSFGCKSCCPTCSEPQPMMVGKKIGTPKPGLGRDADPKNPDDWVWETKLGESCSDQCNFGFDQPPLGSEDPPLPGFGKGNEMIDKSPKRGDSVNPPAPRCIAAGQTARIAPTAPHGGWLNWDEFDFGSGRPFPTSGVQPGQDEEYDYTDPGVYDITLTCYVSAGPPQVMEQCIKRIAVTCTGGGGGGGGGGGTPTAKKQCYEQCASDVECDAGMVCHQIPGQSYSRCAKNPEDSCADDQTCLCQNSCPADLPKPIGVCQ